MSASDRQPADVTRLLDAARLGDEDAWGRLLDLVYPELKRLARSARFGRGDGTLDTTALVHECYLKLAQAEGAPRDRGHLLSLAVRIMRQLLVDHARERMALKRGGDAIAVTFDEQQLPDDSPFLQLLEIDQALERLAAVEPRQARVFECRYFGGLNDEETAVALGISPRTAHRDWDAGRAWLAANL
ncbi:MAG: sigma-70 family RNA polymerase sigma factor [Rhodanobacteraceae bacterium]|nr:sigma-70 family RNA polymerase sigma factor [Xanthomonadales bacterium]MCP5477711.1 sigma-70 family RNA polymerase sigma factor [Rhodanobacteraceae bacterium]HPF73473.1 ECF-type sigma factor [Xanthomonadaceae bacterium]HRY00601.1 ECF-type sigma factor [Xanthomonadaceae bacterium]